MQQHRRPSGIFRILLGALSVFAAAGMVEALFERPEIKRVPIQRLVANIERQLASNPKNVELRLNLARLHAMAYALKVVEFDARPKGEDLEAWFGFIPPYAPKEVTAPPSRDHQERAQQHLQKALKAYAEVVELAPENAIAHLGYAWVLEQARQKQQAIVQYRKAVEAAWPKDRKENAFFRDPVTTEAADRLMELLDPVTDAQEIVQLQEKRAFLGTKGRMVTPIAIPLGSVFDCPPVAADVHVLFDADGSGIRRPWTWVTSDAGWLVHDPDGSGRITSALQWFGNVTFWLFWSNGYHALAALDDDGDGELRGPELRGLSLWADANQNGLSEDGEVKPLSAHRVVSLSTRYEPGDGELTAAYAPAGVTFADGTARPTFDVILRQPSRGGRDKSLVSPPKNLVK